MQSYEINSELTIFITTFSIIYLDIIIKILNFAKNYDN